MHERQDPGSAADKSAGIAGACAGEARLQTFGALVVLDAATLRGRRYTEAALGILGCDAPTLLGESFGAWLTPAVRKVFTAFQHSTQRTQETAIPFPLLASRKKLPVCLHRREGLLLVELLPGRPGLLGRRPALTGETMARVLASSYRALVQADNLQELCQCAATLVQTRLGFAGAAVLRYEPSGAARTQATVDGVKKPVPAEPRLYPASTLPIALGPAGIAHQLVLLADADAPSVELVPSTSFPVAPEDLVGCLLHAPSPACVQKVRELGGRAMLAVRIEQPDGRAPTAGALPWGLILCWDPRPQVPSAATRALAQSLADQFCSQLGVLQLQRRASPFAPQVSDTPADHRRTESQKLDSLGALAAGIAHDFNNLLTGILGNTSLLRADARRGRPTDSYLSQIEETSLRAAELCKQMLAYAGQGPFSVRPVHLNTLIADCLPLLDLGPPPRPVVQLQLAGALPVVRGDVEQLRQVLANLLRNAAEALPSPKPTGKPTGKSTGARPLASTRSPSRPGPPLPVVDPPAPRDDEPIIVSTTLRSLDAATLRTTHGNPDALPGEYVALEVRDTGCGIAATVQARMFEPFFSTKRDARGLGLSTVIGIVRAHGGVLLVHSDPDRGSTFTVFLPVCKSAGDCAAGTSASRF